MQTLTMLVLVLLVTSASVQALETRRISSATGKETGGAKHALLVGIDEYPVKPLIGTVNDVNAWKENLTGRYGFPAANITTLTNRQATKGAILNELNRLERESKPGDMVFFFFSGHGTSSYDTSMNMNMGAFTGALIPADVKMNGSREAMLNSLLVGRSDLRPILEKMDWDRQVVVVVDACYSGNAVRSLARKGPTDSRRISKVLPYDLPPTTDNVTTGVPAAQNLGNASYPYKNVLYISASSDREEAQAVEYDPYDSKPHGALTGALMRGMRGDADSNNDGVVSYDELHAFAQKDVNGKVGHTPQLLADTSFDRTRRIFNAKPALKKDQRSAFSAKAELRLRLDGSAASLVGQLKGMAGLKLSDGDYDLLITSEGGEYQMSLANGDLVTSMKNSQEVKQRVERYLAVRELVGLSNPAAKFNVSLVVGADEGKSVFLNGEQISFQVRSEADVSLLLLDIDPQGYISVVFPARPTDNTRIERGALRTLGETGTVSEPLGVEILKLFAFAKPVEALKHFAGKSPIDPMGKEFAELLRIIKQNSPKGPGWAEATVEVVTTKAQ